jgi:TPP-dependent pyruvate/acetoin dehydrogenase alpha subunit
MQKTILDLYKKAYRIRAVEKEISRRYSEEKMRCPVHLSIGQEAVSAAFSLVVKKKDFTVSTHRGHAHYLAKGGSLKKMIAEIYGKESGCSKGKGGSMHLIDTSCNFMGTSAIVANSIPTGVGLGFSSKFEKKDKISYIFLGDAATEEGVFYESINFSIIKNLPVIFICENNLYSVYSNLSVRQPKGRKIYKMCNSLGIDSAVCDGNDFLKSYRILKKASDFVIKKKKPFFIEFKTYRYLEHCGPNFDNHLTYRSKKEYNYWKKKDPIESFKKKLSKRQLLIIQKFENKVNEEVRKAFLFAERSKFPKKSLALTNVYA